MCGIHQALPITHTGNGASMWGACRVADVSTIATASAADPVVELAARRNRGIPTGFGAGDGDHREASWRADDRHVPSAAAGDQAQQILRDGGRQP
jgi:hypothetical protein